MNEYRCEISTRWDQFAAAANGFRGGYFDPTLPIFAARAPGRLDVMGGIADYSGATVLEMPLANAAFCAVQESPDGRLSARSSNSESHGYVAEVSLERAESVLTLHERPESRWAAYVLGCAAILREEGLLTDRFTGFRFYVESDVPIGAGVSSSAALEVASMLALTSLIGTTLDGITLARLCQRVENEIAGAPCGIMDQVTSAMGKQDYLLALDCRPHTVLGHLPLSENWRFIALDSGVKHSVGGSNYTRARVSAFMGLRIVEAVTGLSLKDYLCNLTEEDWRSVRSKVPETITGGEFLTRYGQFPDSVTSVVPDLEYFPRSASEHPILENERVKRFMELLKCAKRTALREAGDLMLESHRSYTDRVFLGADETDLIVRLAMEEGPERGIHGAKITGGGSGGAVAILCSGDHADSALETIREKYRAARGILPQLLSGSSPGALEFGSHQI